MELIQNSTITYEPGGDMVTYIDGEEVDSRSVSNMMCADNLFFGHDKTDRNQDTIFKAFRIYDRVLNQHEVAYNYAVSQGTAEDPYVEPETEAPTETPTAEVTEPAAQGAVARRLPFRLWFSCPSAPSCASSAARTDLTIRRAASS